MSDATTEETLEEQKAVCSELRDQLAEANDKAKYWETSYKRLEEENERLRNIEIIQEGCHTRITIGGIETLPMTIHKQTTEDLVVYPRIIGDKDE
jgi:hypothetical protein